MRLRRRASGAIIQSNRSDACSPFGIRARAAYVVATVEDRETEIAAPVICFVLFTWFAYRQNGLLQFASMACVPVALAILLGRAIVRRRFGGAQLVALVALIATPFAGGPLGAALRHADFAMRLRPRYERFIARVERGESALGDEELFHPAPPEIGDIAYAVHVSRDETGARCFVFFWGGGFPVRHSFFAHGACAAVSDEYRLHPYDGDWLAGNR